MVKFKDYEFPHVQTKVTQPKRIFVDKLIPGAVWPFRDDIGGAGEDIMLSGWFEGSAVERRAIRDAIKALAGSSGELDLEDGGDSFSALLLDPQFNEDVTEETYSLQLALKAYMKKASLSDSVVISEALTGIPRRVQSLSDPVGITELLKHYKRGPNVGFSTIGSQDYPTETFGKGIGGSTTPMTPNQAYCTKFTLSVPCTVKKVGLYISSGANGNVRCAIYDDDGTGGLPSTLLAESGAVACVNGWNDLTVTSVYLEAGTYWLAHNLSVTGNVVTYDTVSGSGYYRDWTFGAFPNPFGSGASSTSEVSQRATYVRIKGYIKATKFTISEQVTVDKIRFYSHVAAGNVRVGIYDNASPKNLKVESGSVAVAVGWNEIDVTDTVLSAASYPATFFLVWQYNDVSDAPSYTAGASGDGWFKAQAYGAFPATISGETSSAEKWSEDGTQVWIEIT